MIVYQIAMILCVCSESVGTAALSGLLLHTPNTLDDAKYFHHQITWINKTA
jgi:hypothetical protein